MSFFASMTNSNTKIIHFLKKIFTKQPQTCIGENCSCAPHRFLECLVRGLNEDAKSLLRAVEKIDEWSSSGAGWTLLHFSAKYGNSTMTQHLIDEGCRVDAREAHYGLTPLMLAIKARDARMVELLVKNNADIYELTDRNGICSLQLAFYCLSPLERRSRDVLETIFDKVNDDFAKGRLPSNVSDELKSVLVIFGDATLVKFVLDDGYPIDDPRCCGYTALGYAVQVGRFENARMLIEHGADCGVLDGGGRSALREYFGGNDEVLKMVR